MNLLDDTTLLPKKRDYQAVLMIFNQRYGKDQRKYKNMPFTNMGFAEQLSQQFPTRYGNVDTTKQYFAEFWEKIVQWLNESMNSIASQSHMHDFINVEDAHNTITMFLHYDFDPDSNIVYF